MSIVHTNRYGKEQQEEILVILGAAGPPGPIQYVKEHRCIYCISGLVVGTTENSFLADLGVKVFCFRQQSHGTFQNTGKAAVLG